MSFEVGNRVKVTLNDINYLGTVITYADNIYTVSIEGTGRTFLLNDSDMELLSDTGSDLPEVDSGDNEKVLKVIDGEWDKGTPTMNYGQQYYQTILNDTTVTTVSDGTYNKYDDFCSLASFSNGDIVKVTFDGTIYTLSAEASRYGKKLGDSATNYIHYPFYISSGTFPDNATLYTKEAGEHTIKIEKRVTNVTQDFKDAVFGTIKHVKFMTLQLAGGTQITCNYSRSDLVSMFSNEIPIIASIDGVNCASAMQFKYPEKFEFRVLDFSTASIPPTLTEKLITVAESGTPEFTYVENQFDLTLHS